MNKFFDLRFVIGIFFGVVGLMLLIYGLIVYGQVHSGLNITCGALFIVFSLVMIIFSLRGRKKIMNSREKGE